MLYRFGAAPSGGGKRKRVSVPVDDDSDYVTHCKMKKVTSIENVEPGVRQYVKVQRTSTDDDTDDVMFTCQVCANDEQPLERNFQLYTKFLAHLFHDHPNIRPFLCNVCDYSSKCATALFNSTAMINHITVPILNA